MRIDPEKLKEFEEICDDLGLEYYGSYHGRFWHKGYAVVVEDASAPVRLGAAFNESEHLQHLVDHAPHTDSLGLNTILSYDESLFS